MFTRPATTLPEVYGLWWNLGALRVYCLKLALADFGRDSRRSESGRANGSFVFCPVNNARICQFPVSQISRNLHTRRGSMSASIRSENILENLPVRKLFFRKGIFGRSSSTTSDFRPRFLRNDDKSRHDRLASLRNVGFPSVQLRLFCSRVVAFVVLGLVSSVQCQEIGLEERLRNDLFCVKTNVKP